MAVGGLDQEAGGWSAVTHAHAGGGPVRRGNRAALLPWLSAALLIPAVLMLATGRGDAGARSGELLVVQGREIAAASWPDAADAWHPDAAGLVQPVRSASKRAAVHNVLRTTELAEQQAKRWKLGMVTPDDKITVNMFMESECPACRKFSTHVVKEILDAPGVGDIVDFRPVPWGWGMIIEAPTAKQLKADPHAINMLNRTRQLLPILARLGAEGAQPPPLNFECQHGPGECAGNALESCLMDVAPNHEQFFPVMDCVESRTCAEGMKPPLCVGQPAEVVNGCLKDFGADIDKTELDACYNGPRVQELMIINDLQTLKAKPQWVPWFEVDGQALVNVPAHGGNETAIFRQQFLLGKKICDLYVAKTGKHAPEGCASFPQNDAEIGQDPWARFKVANFSSLIAKMDAERQQDEHASTLKKAARKSNSASTAKKIPPHPQAKGSRTGMAAKARKISNFADHFFGHDATHEALTKQLIANAKKRVVPANPLDDALMDVKADKAKLKAFKAVKGQSDASARTWKPPSDNFV